MDGPVPLTGTHQDLLERSALYRDLVGAWHGPAPAVRTSGPGEEDAAVRAPQGRP
jgi:ATP-binding cassette subfamily C protein